MLDEVDNQLQTTEPENYILKLKKNNLSPMNKRLLFLFKQVKSVLRDVFVSRTELMVWEIGPNESVTVC